ncbi:uncharacterized protein [Eurosta solidaginis]|uniref:uncharacterized protein n=1 Tax=Eurosta solidaginis TaxID=178769 RepID=UPI003530ACBA
MAMPNLSATDLEKLKLFINFVTENPTVLNLPQLQFVKDFVEKFGGKVPAGEFKMPAGGAGGKCPFGGNASAGSDSTTGMNVDESDESDLEQSEAESEVELDMEAETFSKRKKRKKATAWNTPTTATAEDNFVDTSAVYLEESKVFSKKQAKRIKTEHTDGDVDYKCPVEAVYGTDTDDPEEDGDDGDFGDYDEDDDMGTDDPINPIASVAMKYEMESDVENDDFRDENYKNDDEENKDKKETDVEEKEDSDSSESSDHQRPLRRITRNVRRSMRVKKGKKPRKKSKNYFKELTWGGTKKKAKHPKPVGCIGKCKKQCEKIDQEQRKKLCKEFWALNFVERKNYLLKCVERKPLGKMRRINHKKKPRKHTNHYIMPTSDGERVRVCLDFFQKTLLVSGYLVKNALENDDGTGNYTGVDLRGGSGEGRRNKIKQEMERRVNSLDESNNKDEKTVTKLSKKEQQEENSGDAAPESQKVISATPGINEIAENETIRLTTIESIKTAAEEAEAEIATAQPKPPPKTIKILNPVAEVGVTVSAVEHAKKQAWPERSANAKPKKKYYRPSRQPRIRTPQPVNCPEVHCKFKCNTKFTEEQRQALCAAFWRLDFKRRKDFVLSRVEIHENTSMTAPEYRKTDRVRTFTNRYFLRGERGENVRVCQRFFNATLCVGCHFLANAQRNIDKQTGAYAGEDLRGKRTLPKNKIPDELIVGVHEHINSYPTWVPHKNYKTRYLHSSLNIKKMHVEYKEDCERQNKTAVSESFFRRIFHQDFKLAFLKAQSKHAHKVSSQRKLNDSNSTVIHAESTLLTAAPTSSAAAPVKEKKINPNISCFTGEEGGFWSQLTPNATETMRFLQQRYAPQPTTAAPVIMSTGYVQQQQEQLQQSVQHQQQPQQQQQQQQLVQQQLSQLQQQHLSQLQQHQHLSQIQQQQPHHPQTTQSHTSQRQTSATSAAQSAQTTQLHPTTVYQFPQIIGYVHQPHIMNAAYDQSEQRAQNFHLL